MTPCLLVGNLSADVGEVALRDAFQAHRAINALVAAAPAAADVTHGFVWLDACAVLGFLLATFGFCLFVLERVFQRGRPGLKCSAVAQCA